mmetsp:Transcript_4257/g.6442  ORF Transcript_4257/g.6442 Transcript_4257/m.6442 type:complete len:257 (+) Transcript_4257:7-777(+)
MLRMLNSLMETAFAKEYLLDTYKFSTVASILNHQALEPDRFKIMLSQTVFHPQGGGQPSDAGKLLQGSTEFQIEQAEQDQELDNVWHIGKYLSSSQFEADQPVTVQIDEGSRRTHAKIHSAGHLLDVAVKMLGYQLVPGKGYHFPQGAYVEYLGNISNEERPQAITAINETMQKLISESSEAVKMMILKHEEAKEVIEVPSYLPEGKPIRIIRLNELDEGCPCGGTHVKHVSEIGSVEVTKIQKKGKNIRLYYKVV